MRDKLDRHEGDSDGDLDVGSLLPLDTRSQLRIFSPASLWDGKAQVPVTWSEVARVNEKRIHPAAAWELISGLENDPSQPGVWDSPPSSGVVPLEAARAVVQAVAALYPDEAEVEGAMLAPAHSGEGDQVIVRTEETDFVVSEHKEEQSMGAHHGRIAPGCFTGGSAVYLRYEILLVRGSLSELLIPDRSWPRCPVSLIWSSMNRWCLAAPPDFPSVYLGGSEELIERIESHDGIESIRVLHNTGVSVESDEVNW